MGPFVSFVKIYVVYRESYEKDLTTGFVSAALRYRRNAVAAGWEADGNSARADYGVRRLNTFDQPEAPPRLLARTR